MNMQRLQFPTGLSLKKWRRMARERASAGGYFTRHLIDVAEEHAVVLGTVDAYVHDGVARDQTAGDVSVVTSSLLR
jgi:hypothetical protein